MQRTRRSVTYQDIQECLSPCSTTDEETTEPCPEEYDTGDFKTPGPAVASSASGIKSSEIKMGIGKPVQVEPCKHHHDVEQLVLECKEYFGRRV